MRLKEDCVGVRKNFCYTGMDKRCEIGFAQVRKIYLCSRGWSDSGDYGREHSTVDCGGCVRDEYSVCCRRGKWGGYDLQMGMAAADEK